MYLKSASECYCATCVGEQISPGKFGGWRCECRCHITPFTDKFIADLDMQDLEIGHKYREVVKHARFLEKHLSLRQDQIAEALLMIKNLLQKH